jgi:hypothetical protein
VLKSVFHKSIAVKARQGEPNNPIKQQTNNCLPTLPYCTLPYSSVPSHHLPVTHHHTRHFVPCLEHSSTTALARFSLGPAMDQEVSRQTVRTDRQAGRHRLVSLKYLLQQDWASSISEDLLQKYRQAAQTSKEKYSTHSTMAAYL